MLSLSLTAVLVAAAAAGCTTPLVLFCLQLAAAGGTEAAKANAAEALDKLHSVCWTYSLAERFDYTALRPSIPDLMQLLRSKHQRRQEVAALMLWDMSFCDRDSVAELLAAPESLAALGAALGSSSKRLSQAAAAVLLNCAGSAGFCSAVLAQPQSIIPQLVLMLQPHADDLQMICFKTRMQGSFHRR